MWEDPGSATLRREMEYAVRCLRYTSLRYTTPGYRPIHLGDNLHIYPTNSGNKALFLVDAIRLGLKIIKRWEPQVIISQDAFGLGLIGLLLKNITGLPLVVHYHSGFLTNPYWVTENFKNRLISKLGVFISHRADVIRTVSSDIRKDLIRRGFEARKIFYATPPVEADAFLLENREREIEIIREFNLDPRKTFIFIGRLSKEKNLPIMLRAVHSLSREHPDLKLMIAGKGPEEKIVRTSINQLGLKKHVILLGAIPNKRLKDYVRTACALVITSNYEGTAKVIKEAAFAGITTVTTNTSGVRDTIKGGETGLIIPIANIRALVKAMEYLINNPGQTLLMGNRAREFILKKFNYRKDVDRIVDVWRQALTTAK